jgi:hypothetical protein
MASTRVARAMVELRWFEGMLRRNLGTRSGCPLGVIRASIYVKCH